LLHRVERNWDIAGQRTTQAASLRALSSSYALLEEQTGQVVVVSRQSLSVADQRFLREPKNLTKLAPADLTIGRVVAVTDGDTITIRDGTREYVVRLRGIDAPETRQPFGEESKGALAKKVFGKAIVAEWRGKDKYGRLVAAVFVDGRCLNREMVAEGWAWHYTKYDSDRQLSDAEQAARGRRLGLWRQSNPVPPWEFRQIASE
jgi:endonuclease YncB( thermonuclease family)